MRHKNSKIKTGNKSCPSLFVLAFHLIKKSNSLISKNTLPYLFLKYSHLSKPNECFIYKREKQKKNAHKTHTLGTHTHSQGKIGLRYWISLIRRDTPTQRITASCEPQTPIIVHGQSVWTDLRGLISYCTTFLLDLDLTLLLLKINWNNL